MAQRNSQSEYCAESHDSSPGLLFESACEVTTASDQLKLGIAYFNAIHTDDNCHTAFKWIKLSAEQGNMEAQFRLSELYSLGLGTSRSHTDAYKWYTKAAIQGYKKASIRIHNLYQEDIKMHCRGRLNSEEKHREKPEKNEYVVYEKTEYYYRELYEQRLDDYKLVLNHAMEYYATQFEKYKSLNQEDPEIQQNLGFLYQHGYGVKKYDKWAIEYYTKAAEQGYVDSQYQLGCLYQKNTDIKFNYRKAFHWYHLAANGGNTAAQNRLAYFYEKGLGTGIDYQRALSWYIKAAESGHSGAQLNLGKWYRKGEHVVQNYDVAAKWYLLAAQQGNSAAPNCLNQLYQTGKISNALHAKDTSEDYICDSLCSKLQSDILRLSDIVPVENIKKLAKRALVGDGNSMYQVGLKYYYGTDFAEDRQIGFKWIKNAAGTGLQEAIFRVIKMYEEGDTVQQNYHKASIWAKRVAKSKNSKALCDLGILYNEGRGVRNDPLEASKWFTLSAEQGGSEAQYRLGCLRQKGRGLRKDKKEALKLFELSAKQGNSNGCYKYGLALSSVDESESDDENESDDEDKYNAATIKLLKYSSKNGNAHAQYKLWKNYHDKKLKLEAGSYFDMLMISNDISVISKMVEHAISYGGVSVGYINYFNLLEKAANLGISTAQDVFRAYLDFLSGSHIGHLIQAFTLVSVKGISSMEYHIAHIYKNKSIFINGKEIVENDTRAIYWYDISAKKGDSRALVRLGIFCEEGTVFNQSFSEAIKYYHLACKKGNKDAMYRLACMYLDGRGVSQDLGKAFELFSQASDMGHIEAREVLMLPCKSLIEEPSENLYYEQIEVNIKDDNRIKMLEQMAERGLVAIQYQLGTYYQNDVTKNENEYECKDKDDSKAVKWFTLAAQGEITDACYRLGILYEEGRGSERDYKKAMSFYKKAIRNEHEDSMYRLAQMYLYGRGTEINYKKAYQLYSKAAKMGHVLSYNILDFNLTFDENLSLNESNHTVLMLRYVAEEGDAESQYKLGYFYESSLNEQNDEEAAKWYSMAVDNSHAEAMYRLGLLYETRFGAMQNYKKAIHLYNQAYNLGNYDALYRLGTVYQYGVVAYADPERAVQCYTEAANQGHLKSQFTLGKLYEEGLLIQKNALESLRWYTRAYLKGYDSARIDLYAVYDCLPYEKYFYRKRNKILLSVSDSLLYSNRKEYMEIYGIIFYKLGVDYLFGNGIDQDYAKAWKCFQESATIFDNSSARNIINIYYDGDRNTFLKAVDMYKKLFDDLLPEQQYSLAMLYYLGLSETSKYITFNTGSVENNTSCEVSDNIIDKQGIILSKNYHEAIFYLEKVTADGHYYNQAHLILAQMYTQGLGAEKNIEKVIEHYTKAYNECEHFALRIAQLFHFDNEFCDYSKAIEWYKKVAEYEYEAALNIIGLIYKNGIGANQDYVQALHYFKLSTYYSSSLIFRSNTRANQDYVQNLNVTKISSNYGNRCAFYNAGLMYYHGQGVEKNYSEAYVWFTSAAESNHLKAQMYLADMYLHGYGVEKNIKKAKKWFSKASAECHLIPNGGSENESVWVVDIFYSDFPTENIEWCKKIQENDPVISLSSTEFFDDTDNFVDVDYSDNDGSSISVTSSISVDPSISAHYPISADYSDGAESNEILEEHTNSSHKEVHEVIMNSVELTEGDSSYILGEMYYSGEGVQKDYNESYHYFLKADEKNNSDAQYRLAEMYMNGYGVDQNTNRAIELYTKAANNNDDVVPAVLGELYHYNNEIQDFSKAFEWYQKVQGSNKSYAFRGIGLLFEYGDGVDQNFQKSVEYYQQSANLGNKGGYYNLALMYYYGKDVDQDYEMCFSLLNQLIYEDPVDWSSYVFVRIKNISSAHDLKENRLYSHENEAALYGEVYYQLGIMYKNGQGTDQYLEEAKKCFLKAVDYGNEQAKVEL